MEYFAKTCELYSKICSENKYEVSDFVRRSFKSEMKLLNENKSDEDFIYFKLCGDNKLLTDHRITDEQLKALCEALKDDVSIKSLDLRYNLISSQGAEYLMNMLQNNKTLTELNLMGNNINDDGAKSLSMALANNTTLRILKMTGNKIGDNGGMFFARALQLNNTLEELDLGECDLEIGSVIAFTTVLKCNTSIVSINLSRPLLWTQQEETSVHVEQMLTTNATLKRLHLCKYEMRDFSVERICDALVINSCLTFLDLSCNRITRDGAAIIAKVLSRNSPLKVLDLGYNRIHNQGIAAIAQSLSYCNTNLKCLVITYNEIGEEGLLAIAQTLDANSTLEQLYVWGNNFTSRVCQEFNKYFDTSRLQESQTDIRPYQVDNKFYVSYLPHSTEYTMYRYVAPIYGSDVPKNRSYAIM